MNPVIMTGVTQQTLQDAQCTRPMLGELRQCEDGLRGFFEELEGNVKEGFMAFRTLRAPGGELVGFRCIYVNRAAERLIRRRADGTPMERLLPQLDCMPGGNMFKRFARAVETGVTCEGRVHAALGGSEGWYRGVVIPFREGVAVRFHEVPCEELCEDVLPRDMAYRLLSRVTNDVLWDWNLVTGRVTWGEALQRVLGYESDAGTDPQWWMDCIHPDDRARVVDGLHHVLHGGEESWSDRFRYRRADGSYAFVFGRGFVVRDEAGRACRVVGSMLDLTERVRAEEALVQQETVHRLLSRVTDDVLWEWDMARGEVLWGEALYRVFGYAPEQVGATLQWWIDRVHPRDRDRVLGSLYGVINGGGEAWSDEYRYLRADGQYAYVLGRGFVARDPSGKPVRVVGSMVDLTDRMRARQALRESEERFRATFDQAAVGIALVAPAGNWLRANQRLCDILGYTEEELGRSRLQELSHPDERADSEERLRRVLGGALASDVFERRLRRRDGGFVWTQMTLSGARNAAGELAWLIAVVEDIQDRKRLEEETRRAVEFENQLYGMMGHDIRSPLAALKATISSLLLRSDGLSAQQMRALARIARSTNRIHRLVQELLDYTRMRLGGGLSLQARTMEVRAFCEQVVGELEEAHPGRVRLSSLVEGRVRWDPERVKQLLGHLVENALTHGARDRPVRVLLGGDEEQITLQVHNEGEPIPPERLARIFEPFSYGPEVEQTVKLSLGMGLHMVREVARAHGGSVSVRSTREEGTTFVVKVRRFPAQRGTDA